MRFDGYCGTIREVEFDHVGQALGASLGGTVERGQPRRRYGEVLDVRVAGRLAVWAGWDKGNGTVYFEGKGETSPDLARAVRTHFPGHSVARADVCEDYEAEGAFERLVGVVRGSKGPRVDGGYVRLPDDEGKGRTWAAGVRGGVGYVRVYEAGLMADRAHLCRPRWVRSELEARPHYAAHKAAAASLEPLHFWGLAAWTARVGQALSQVEVPRVAVESRDYSHDRTALYLARTFRRFWSGALEDFGSWECVGREFEQIWREDDEAVEAMKRGAQ